MQRITIFCKILCRCHYLAHGLENVFGLAIYLLPGASESVDGCGAKCRYDGSQRREVVESTTFLQLLAHGEGGILRDTYISNRNKMFNNDHPPFHICLVENHLGHPIRQLVGV